jgi:hypothetical protein
VAATAVGATAEVATAEGANSKVTPQLNLIWHFVFEFANRALVEEGLFANPYAEDRRYQGFLPVVSDAGLAESPRDRVNWLYPTLGNHS